MKKFYSRFANPRLYSNITKLFKNEFNYNVLTLFSGTAAAQFILVIISPILTRLYSPSDFGSLAIFISLTSVFSTASCGRYEVAIVLPDNDKDAINVAAAGFIFNILTTLFLFLLILFSDGWLLRKLNAQNLNGWILFVPLVVFFSGIFNILKYANTRLDLYQDMAKANIYKSITAAITQLGLGIAKLGVGGLISGQILSSMIANLKLLENIYKKGLLKYISINNIKAMAKKYIRFPIFSVWAGLMNTAGYQLINILIGIRFGPTVLGYYYLINRILGIPSTMIGSSVSQVFYNMANKEKLETNTTRTIFRSTLKKLTILSALFFIPVFLLIKPMFAVIFGKEWQEASLYIMILIPMFAIRFVSSTLSVILFIYQKQQLEIFINLLITGSIIVIIIISKTPTLFFLIMSLTLSALYLFFLCLYDKISHMR